MRSASKAPVPARRALFDDTRSREHALVVVAVALAGTVVAELVARPVSAALPWPAPWRALVVWLLGYGITAAVVAVVSLRAGSGSWTRDFGLATRPRDAGWAVAGFVAMYLISLAIAAAGPVPVVGDASTVAAQPFALALLNRFVAACLVAPFFEEVVFRGIVLRGLRAALRSRMRRSATRDAWADVLAIAVSAALFAAFHLTDSGSRQHLVVLAVSAAALGVVTGVITLRTGRVSAAIIVHVLLNVVAVSMTAGT